MYVGFRRRALAALIDNATWLVFFAWFLGGVIEGVDEESTEAAGVIVFVYLSLWFNYFAFSEWRWGQTIGKNATGIKVIRLDGGKISFGQASLRNLLRLIDFFVIGWILVAATARKQRLGDMAAKTVVVRRKPRAAAAPASAAATAAAAAPPAPPPPPPPPQAAVAAQAGAGPQVPAPPQAPPPPAAAAARGRLPAIGWSSSETVWGLIGGLLLAFLLAPALILPFDPELDSDGGLLAAQALLGTTLLAVSIGVASSWRFRPLRGTLGSLGLRRFRPSALGWMLAALFAYWVAAALFSVFLIEPEQDDIGGELGVGDENLVVAVLAVAMIAVLAPISEEIFFRGFLFSGLRRRLSLWPAALIAGLIFGSIHAVTGLTTVLPLAALGVALCWLYERTGSLWPCVFAHMFNNGLALVLIT